MAKSKSAGHSDDELDTYNANKHRSKMHALFKSKPPALSPNMVIGATYSHSDNEMVGKKRHKASRTNFLEAKDAALDPDTQTF